VLLLCKGGIAAHQCLSDVQAAHFPQAPNCLPFSRILIDILNIIASFTRLDRTFLKNRQKIRPRNAAQSEFLSFRDIYLPAIRRGYIILLKNWFFFCVKSYRIRQIYAFEN
jgi:hypothetical protein